MSKINPILAPAAEPDNASGGAEVNEAQWRAVRVNALRALVELQVEPVPGVTRLSDFGWGSDEELVTLRVSDASNALECYIRGRITAADLQLWADALEGRDDLGFDPRHSPRLKDLLFQLSTPEINGAITPEVASRWLIALTRLA